MFYTIWISFYARIQSRVSVSSEVNAWLSTVDKDPATALPFLELTDVTLDSRLLMSSIYIILVEIKLFLTAWLPLTNF